MPSVSLTNAAQTKQQWVPIRDVHTDENGNIITFEITNPDWCINPGLHHLHLISRNHSTSDIASGIWNASLRFNSARSLLRNLEEIARETKWYDVEKRPYVQEHAGKVGLLIASADLLAKFLKTRPFSTPGYYNFRQKLILSGPPYNVETSNDYMD